MYRVTINGFKCENQTDDDLLQRDGWFDEIYFSWSVAHKSDTGSLSNGAYSDVYGQLPPGNVFPRRRRAGTGTSEGGVKTGDMVPFRQGKMVTEIDVYGIKIPIREILPAWSSEPKDEFPIVVWQGELKEGESVTILPLLWEWDGGGIDPRTPLRLASEILTATATAITPFAPIAAPFVLLGAAILAGFAGVIKTQSDRIIGTDADKPEENLKDMKGLILTKDNIAAALNATSGDMGKGIFSFIQNDTAVMGHGRYTFYLQVAEQEDLESESMAAAEVFDAEFYLSQYSDAGSDTSSARHHWLKTGIKEGRRGCAAFDVQFYLNYYSDLKAAFNNDYVRAMSHWLNTGLAVEGRRGALEFDVRYYVELYSDLKAAFGNNFRAAQNHWVTMGLPVEGRRGSREFDIFFYMQGVGNQDIGQAYGADHWGGMHHWLRWGLPQENRGSSEEFSIEHYVNANPDLPNEAKTRMGALAHWLSTGLPQEGRQASKTFHAKFYLSTYPDLQVAFGATNYLAAVDHWIRSGKAEKRQGVAV